ncbi:hypothetical protein EJ02DRAFT_434007 [Clathrospora elynae]|uniref:Uncharacterized protein n=1 Tax=Clathrospora elynae TaxID=706981 RepID=A0A6A5SZS3_9PLEO|nr:hypothetical protein EJ02DRAFT_434007 [Clathrospora elynae]
MPHLPSLTLSAPSPSTPRKPWDPPFLGHYSTTTTEKDPRKGKDMETKANWHILPATPPRKTGREMEEKGLARRLFAPDVDGDGHGEYEDEDEDEATPSAIHESTPLASAPRSISTSSPAKNKKGRSGAMSIVWLLVAILAVMLFILAFAILVAHCLAWFLVYKTEARLGEARRGIMHGGEMRLCLCAA